MSAGRLVIGCCAALQDLEVLEATAGLDYIELPVARSLMCTAGEFEGHRVRMRRSNLTARAANVFLPATLKVVGPEARPDELAEYAATAFDRACRIGVALVVFGSGASRMVPSGYHRDRALEEFEGAVRIASALASARGVTLAIEPLHSEETNLINTVAEAAAFVRDRRLDGVRVVADIWHMEREGEQLEVLDDAGALVAHAHVAADDRRAPGQASDRIDDFLRHLREARYSGACSIECRWTDLASELPAAVARVQQAAQAAGWARA
jgi:D-psicose/D-tagatose/L-ribulose 3-epimerase